jgi:NDP-sugar pyrophosphorylase family protein
MCVGHLGEQIEACLGDGSQFGLDVSYAYDGQAPVGTAAAVRGALPLLGPHFLVLYGDTYLRIDYAAVQRAFLASGRPALMTVLRNTDAVNHASNTVFRDGLVIAHDKRHPSAEMEWIDYGVGALTAEAMRTVEPDAPDLSDVYGALAARGELAGFEATNRFYEIGTPAALAETDQFLREHSVLRAHDGI